MAAPEDKVDRGGDPVRDESRKGECESMKEALRKINEMDSKHKQK
jgi:hypothetical protein